jgi:hypothetical protein
VHLGHAEYSPVLNRAQPFKITLHAGRFHYPAGTILSTAKINEYYRLSIRWTEWGRKIAIFRYLVDRRSEIENGTYENYPGLQA